MLNAQTDGQEVFMEEAQVDNKKKEAGLAQTKSKAQAKTKSKAHAKTKAKSHAKIKSKAKQHH